METEYSLIVCICIQNPFHRNRSQLINNLRHDFVDRDTSTMGQCVWSRCDEYRASFEVRSTEVIKAYTRPLNRVSQLPSSLRSIRLKALICAGYTPYIRALASWFPYTIAYALRALLQPVGNCAIERNSYSDRPTNRSIGDHAFRLPSISMKFLAWIVWYPPSTEIARTSVFPKFISLHIFCANLAGFIGRR